MYCTVFFSHLPVDIPRRPTIFRPISAGAGVFRERWGGRSCSFFFLFFFPPGGVLFPPISTFPSMRRSFRARRFNAPPNTAAVFPPPLRRIIVTTRPPRPSRCPLIAGKKNGDDVCRRPSLMYTYTM